MLGDPLPAAHCRLVVPPAGRLVAGRLHDCLAPAAEGPVVLDLHAARWIEPIGLVAVAALAEQARASGRGVRLLRPARAELAHYLARMRLGAVLDRLEVPHDLPRVAVRDAGLRLVELRRFDGPAEPDLIAALLFRRTRERPELASALHRCVAEIAANVPEHSGRTWGYVAAQTTAGDARVQFAVGDAGRGVAEGFRPALDVDDGQALSLALQQGVSRTGLPGHGRGLRTARGLVTGLGGSLHMLSGRAFRTAHPRTSVTRTMPHGWSGTLLQGSFPVEPSRR